MAISALVGMIHPIAINIVVEDRLSEAVFKAVLNQVERNFMVAKRFPDLKRTHANSGFGYIKIKIPGFERLRQGRLQIINRMVYNKPMIFNQE